MWLTAVPSIRGNNSPCRFVSPARLALRFGGVPGQLVPSPLSNAALSRVSARNGERNKHKLFGRSAFLQFAWRQARSAPRKLRPSSAQCHQGHAWNVPTVRPTKPSQALAGWAKAGALPEGILSHCRRLGMALPPARLSGVSFLFHRATDG
jgi:hypothetical protein